MDHSRISRRTHVWIWTGIAVLSTILLVPRLAGPSWFFVSPDSPRPWATAAYLKAVTANPRPAEPNPIDWFRGYTGMQHSSPGELDGKPVSFHEDWEANASPQVLVSGEDGNLELPDGNGLRLAAAVVVPPWEAPAPDLNWKDAPFVQGWWHPMTGEVLHGYDNVIQWRSFLLPRSCPRIFLIIEKKIPEQPMRWFSAAVYDARTHLMVSPFHELQEKDGLVILWSEIEVWHQTKLLVTLDFNFGKPDYKPLQFFHDTTRSSTAKPAPQKPEPRPANSLDWNTVRLDPKLTESFNLPILRTKPLYEMLNTLERPTVTTGTVIPSSRAKKKPPTRLLMERRFPYAGRAVFTLNQLPGFPAMKNLFDTPIPSIILKNPYEVTAAMTHSTGIQANFAAPGLHLPTSAYPIKLANTTPKKIIEECQKRSGVRLYFSAADLALSDTKPESRTIRLLRTVWNTWFP